MRRGEGRRAARSCCRGRPGGPSATSRTVTDGAAQPGLLTAARPLAGRRDGLAFRPGPLASTLHSAWHVKPARPGTGAGLTPVLKPRVDTCRCPPSQQGAAPGEGRPPGGYREGSTVARARATVVPAASRRPGTGAAALGQRVMLMKCSGMAVLVPRAAASLTHLHKSGFECLFSPAAEKSFRQPGHVAACRESTKVSVGSAYLSIARPQRLSICPSATGVCQTE
jgi:hypothetical protein